MSDEDGLFSDEFYFYSLDDAQFLGENGILFGDAIMEPNSNLIPKTIRISRLTTHSRSWVGRCCFSKSDLPDNRHSLRGNKRIEKFIF